LLPGGLKQSNSLITVDLIARHPPQSGGSDDLASFSARAAVHFRDQAAYRLRAEGEEQFMELRAVVPEG